LARLRFVLALGLGGLAAGVGGGHFWFLGWGLGWLRLLGV
jgi:hypothetical protein